ncbi:secretory component protein-like protein shr3 [Mytilinidion resinicola]|uniref:Secretory component protein-like protein shr3 n=1 Tax=Mytilinidion resinicola TaxID=574789 RepID=A0A6A6YNY5_9PEZI|nr:secretory component protein-like protein shr3 [Mytilinidion resinicola]KAF2810490.1 secretory component protein-like protein shr3 [Mytilinidion resinicola]
MPAPNSFATFLIIGPTCFFLGILFSNFPYDYNVLWATPPDREPYYVILEEHLRFLYNSPPIISRILHISIAVGILGFLTKLYKPSEANMLFDGAALVLYLSGITVYITNVVKGLKVINAGIYGNMELIEGETLASDPAAEADDYISREDTLRVFAASNTILALVMVGVLVLQAGQWYAQRKEDAEIEAMNKADKEKKAAGKKKQ